MAKRKAEKARIAANEYKETHHMELTLYNTAKNHFDKCMKPGYKDLPVKKWRAEYAELEVQKIPLNKQYNKLKEETREVEVMRRTVENIVRAERPKQQSREQGMEI